MSFLDNASFGIGDMASAGGAILLICGVLMIGIGGSRPRLRWLDALGSIVSVLAVVAVFAGIVVNARS